MLASLYLPFLVLWPVFGATNQLLAGLSFLVICFYLIRHRKPVWFLLGPMALMLMLPAWVLTIQIFGKAGWLAGGKYLLAGLGIATFGLQIWMVVEGALMYRRAKGVPPAPLPPLIKDGASADPSC